MFIVLLITVASCTELSELSQESERMKRERGRKCKYDGYGRLKFCEYAN